MSSNKNASVKKKELIAIAYAEDRNLAKDYKNLLIAKEIPVTVEKADQEGTSSGFGYAIKVPEEYIDTAYKIIEMKNPADYFFDGLFDDDELFTDIDQDVY